MAKEKTKKKENKILLGIIFILFGIFAIAKNNEFVWVLFGAVEIPLWILGGLGIILGVVTLSQGIKEKKEKDQ